MPFRTNITTQLAFTNDASLLSKEVLSMTFDQFDYQLGVRFKYHRNRAITPAYAIDPNMHFWARTAFNEIDIERPLLVGDQAAICLNYGQVTQRHAQRSRGGLVADGKRRGRQSFTNQQRFTRRL